jgi:hypothetical protein
VRRTPGPALWPSARGRPRLDQWYGVCQCLTAARRKSAPYEALTGTELLREHTMSYQDVILESQREIQRQQEERARNARLLRIRHLRQVKLAVRELLRGVK